MERKQLITIFLTIVFLFSLNLNDARADWVDKSGDLPGMTSDGEMTGLLIGTAVLITGLVVVLVVMKKKKNKSESTSLQMSNPNNLGLTKYKTPTSFYNELYRASEQSPLQVFTAINQLPNQNMGNNLSLSVGVRFTF